MFLSPEWCVCVVFCWHKHSDTAAARGGGEILKFINIIEPLKEQGDRDNKKASYKTPNPFQKSFSTFAIILSNTHKNHFNRRCMH